jgi:hypothetical protein
MPKLTAVRIPPGGELLIGRYTVRDSRLLRMQRTAADNPVVADNQTPATIMQCAQSLASIFSCPVTRQTRLHGTTARTLMAPFRGSEVADGPEHLLEGR